MPDEQEYEGSYDEYQDGLAEKDEHDALEAQLRRDERAGMTSDDVQAEHERKAYNKWVEELKEGADTPELRAFIDRLKE